MATEIYVVNTSTGSPVEDASIACGGCSVTNGGGGFYSVGVDLSPGSGAIVAAAPGMIPVTITWFTLLFTHTVGMEPAQKIEEPGGKW